MAEAFENILLETPFTGLARITINRPSKLNSLDASTLRELGVALDALEDEIRVLAITGAGEKAFVAGADIAEMVRYSVPEAEAFSRLGHEVFARLEAMDRVVIAEVNGYALGGGFELALACDLAVASDNARFGQPEVALGVTPGFGGTTRLARRVGPTRARYLLFTGEQVHAPEALTMGIVNAVVPKTELRAKVDGIAQKILKNSPLGVARTKRSIRMGEETPLAVGNAFEQQMFAGSFASEDLREGMTAFLEKRPATWKGR